MVSVNRIINYYPSNIDFAPSQKSDFGKNGDNIEVQETYTTWRFDEEGNIVYYTYNKKTGELISKTKYKNPGKIT